MIKYSIWNICLLIKVDSGLLVSKQFFQVEYSNIGEWVMVTWEPLPLPMDRMTDWWTDTNENITFPQLRCQTVEKFFGNDWQQSKSNNNKNSVQTFYLDILPLIARDRERNQEWYTGTENMTGKWRI